MNRDNDNGSVIAIGGLAVALVGIWIVLKGIEKLCIQAKETFNAIEHSAEAFIPMSLKVLALVGLGTAIVFCVVAAVYFTVKYVRLVQKATDLRQYIESRLDDFLVEFKQTTEAKFNETAEWLRRDVRIMERRLEEALKPATATPTPATVTKTSAEVAVELDLPEETEALKAEYEEVDQDPDATTDDEFTESQPY